jgi:hypothetical protein
LIEMAIVLIIIGIIIGAVVKGKDIIRSGEQKKIYTKFINGWQSSYLSFYDRTGKILGDTFDGAGNGQDGEADTGGGDGTYSAGVDEIQLCNSTDTDWYGLMQAGIACPTTNVSNSPNTYDYVDSSGNKQTLTIYFDFDGTGTNNYNYMAITGITTEFAIAVDSLVDGSADGTSGDFLNATGASTWGLTPTTLVVARWRMQI